MFVDIESTSEIQAGDILYFKKSQSTREIYWQYAVRVDRIEDDTYVCIDVPDVDVVESVSVEEWNKNPCFDGGSAHYETGVKISRLVMLVRDYDLSNEDAASFLEEF